MSFLTIKVLYCDRCDTTFGDTPGVTVAKWRIAAAHEGWINSGTLDWCSRKCATLVTPTEECICVKLKDTGGFQIADLTCPIHGIDGTSPGDWQENNDE